MSILYMIVNEYSFNLSLLFLISMSFFVASMSVTCLLSTILTFCICILALCNHQFTYRADIVMLIFSFVLIVASGFFSIFMFLINVFLTVLTLVPLCSRACGYNMCVETVRTRESLRKALKEILPLFILPLPSYIYIILFLEIILSIFYFQLGLSFQIAVLVSSALGLVTALSLALHLCFIGKANLNKQRGIKKTPQVNYGTVNQRPTRHTTMYTMGEGMSETCNTEFPYVSEGEEDTRYLQQRNNQQ